MLLQLSILQKETLYQAKGREADSVPASGSPSAVSTFTRGWETLGPAAWCFHRNAGSGEGCWHLLSSPNATSGGVEGWCWWEEEACSEQ